MARLVDACAQAGAKDIHEAQHDRQAFGQARGGSSTRGERARCLAAVEHGRQQLLLASQPECRENLGHIGASAEVAEGKRALGGVGGALAGELEVEPVLAVAGCGGAGEELRRVALEPDEVG